MAAQDSSVMMQQGSVMQLLTAGSGDVVTARPVLVWWEPGAKPTKLGSILYSDVLDPSNKKKVDGQELPMSRISDVFSGKQHPVFKSEAASFFPSDQCFALGSKKAGLGLNLVASTAAERTAWIGGIKAAFAAVTAAKKAEAGGSGAAPAVAAAAAATTNGIGNGAAPAAAADSTTAAAPVDAPAAAAAAAAAPAAAPALENGGGVASLSAIDAMISGQSFLSFTDSTSPPRDVFVWYDSVPPRVGILYQTDLAQQGEEQQRPLDERTSVSLSRVTDVFLGKRSAEFSSSPYASSYPSAQCFSIVASKGASMHLVAPTQAVRDTWLQGVKEVFAKRKEASAAKKAASASASAPLPVQTQVQQENAHTAPMSGVGVAVSPSSSSSSAPPNVLAEGRVYRSVVLDASAPGGARASDIFLWHEVDVEKKSGEKKLGTLYWSAAAGDKTKVAGQSMPVKSIRDVMLGKQTAELRSEFTKDVPSSYAFSLMADKDKGEGLNLIAANEAERNATIATIKGFWPTSSSSGKKSKNNTATAGTIAAATAAAAVGTEPAAASSQLTAADQAALAEAARKVEQSLPEAQAPPQTSLLAEPEPPQQQYTGVVRVHMGNLGNSAGEEVAAEASRAPVASALTVAPTAAPTSADASPVSPVSPVADREAAAALIAHVASDPQRNIETMTNGSVFRVHDLSGHNPSVRDAFLFLSQDGSAQDGPIGTIYWNDGTSADRTRSQDRSFNLSLAKDVFTGRNGWKDVGPHALAQVASVPSTRLFTITSARHILYLEAPSDEVRARWVTGIRNCFERANREAALAKQRSASPNGSVSPVTIEQHAGVELLSNGANFTSHLVLDDGSIRAVPVFVWYDPAAEKMGSIFWANRGSKEKVPGQSMPLDKVTDVFLGKHALLKHRPEMSAVRTAHMFSLATRKASVHLEAANGAQRAEWVGAIRSFFISGGKRVDGATHASSSSSTAGAGKSSTGAGVGPTFPEIPMSPRNGAGSSGAVSPRTLAIESQNPLPVVATPIGDGADFEAWSFVSDSSASSSSSSAAQGRRLQVKKLHVWFESYPGPLGALYWSDESTGASGRRVRSPGALLPLAELSDVFIGKLTEEFQHPDASGVPADRCLSLRSASHPEHNLNLVAPSAQAQRRWVRGLKKQFSTSPDTVIETRPVRDDAAADAALLSASPRSARAIQLKLDALAAGHPATLLDDEGRSTDVTVWLDREEARAGTLYFSDRAQHHPQPHKNKDESRKIAVHTISDVYVGKKTATFKSRSASHVASNTAFSVGNKSGAQTRRLFNAYTRTAAERATIIQGIEAAILSAGTPVREYVHGKPKQSAASKSIGNAVESNPGALARTSGMQQGTIVLLHGAQGAPQAIFLWYEPSVGKQGSFRWTLVPQGGRGKVHRRFEPKHELKLQHIADVMSGRQSEVLRAAPAATGARNANCFSLHTRGGAGLNIQMRSGSERDAWLSALRSVFALTNKRIVEGAGAAGGGLGKVKPTWNQGDTVDTWFGRGVVADTSRTASEGLTLVAVGDTRCYLNNESIKPVPFVYTPFGRGVAPSKQSAVRADGIRTVELPWATAYLNAESYSDRDPATASSSGASSHSRDDSVAFLVAGSLFVRITSRGTSQTVWASLNPSAGGSSPAVGRLGVLEFRHESSGPLLGSIALADMSDLYVGRQTPQLRAQGLSSVPESRAFTITTRGGPNGAPGAQVDLVAPRDQDRTDWIYALFNVLSGSGRQVSRGRNATSAGGKSPAPSPSPSASPSPPRGSIPAGRRYSFTRPNGIPTFGESERILSRGVVGQMLVVRKAENTRESALRAIIWLDVHEDRLYWMPMPLSAGASGASMPGPEQAVWRSKNTARSMALSAVTDVYYNKKTGAFLERAFVGTPKHQCMSIGAGRSHEGLEWNIVCPGREDRDEIFFALQGLLTSRDRAARVQASNSPHSPSSFAHTVVSPSSEQWSPRGPSSASPPAPVVVPVSGRDEQGFNVLSRGVVLTLWEGEGNAVTSSRVFLFHEYDEANSKDKKHVPAKYGSLYWNSTEGDRTRSPARCFPLHQVRDVFCGKNNTPATRSSAMEHVPKGQVVSLVAAPIAGDTNPPRSLNIQVASSAHRAAFVNGLKEFWGKKRAESAVSASAVAAVPPPADFSPRASAGSVASFTRSSPMGSVAVSASSPSNEAGSSVLAVRQPSTHVTGPPVSAEFLASLSSAPTRGALCLPPAVALAFVQAGSAFTSSGEGAIATESQQVDAFYVAAAGFDAPFGTIYTSARGSRQMDDTRALAVHRIERVVVGSDVLRIETSTQKLSLHSSDLPTLAVWVAALHYVLSAAGFRITQSVEGSGAYDINDRSAAALNASPAVISLPVEVASRTLSFEGMQFNALFPQFGSGQPNSSPNGSNGPKVTRSALTLFEEEGALWISQAGSRTKDASDEARRFPLRDLKRVTVGGRYGALSLSLQSRDNYIDLEAESVESLALFLASLSALVQRPQTGIAVVAEKDACTALKRCYILTPRRSTPRGANVAAPTHAVGSSPVDVHDAVSPRTAQEAREAFESAGASVTAYTLRSGGALQHKELILWVGTDPSDSDASLLCWGSLEDDDYTAARMPDPAGDNILPLDEVLSVQVGKLTPTLLALGDESAVPAAHCVSVTSAGTCLDVVAASAAEARAIVDAIKARDPKNLVLKQ